jgi:hypothetical protein
METTLIFGTFTRVSETDSVSYSCPNILSDEIMKRISFSEEISLPMFNENNEVTNNIINAVSGCH